MLAQIQSFIELRALCQCFLVLSGSRGYPLRSNIGLVATTPDVVGSYRSISANGGTKLASHDC
jgi:hypothetical protein